MAEHHVTHGLSRKGNYSERGISICDQWRDDPAAFVIWGLSRGWRPGLTIERKEVNGNYCPENCCFVTPDKQAQHAKESLPNRLWRDEDRQRMAS